MRIARIARIARVDMGRCTMMQWTKYASAGNSYLAAPTTCTSLNRPCILNHQVDGCIRTIAGRARTAERVSPCVRRVFRLAQAAVHSRKQCDTSNTQTLSRCMHILMNVSTRAYINHGRFTRPSDASLFLVLFTNTQ